MVNGISGSDKRYGDSEWLGWSGKDFEGTIDLGKKQNVSKIILRFFNSPLQWIYLPKGIEIAVSEDGDNFTKIGQSSGQPDNDTVVKTIEIPVGDIEARFIKLNVERFGIIPEGKQGAGNEAWLFIDEIIVN